MHLREFPSSPLHMLLHNMSRVNHTLLKSFVLQLRTCQEVGIGYLWSLRQLPYNMLTHRHRLHTYIHMRSHYLRYSSGHVALHLIQFFRMSWENFHRLHLG